MKSHLLEPPPGALRTTSSYIVFSAAFASKKIHQKSLTAKWQETSQDTGEMPFHETRLVSDTRTHDPRHLDIDFLLKKVRVELFYPLKSHQWQENKPQHCFFFSVLRLLYIWWGAEVVMGGLTESIFNQPVRRADPRPDKVDTGGEDHKWERQVGRRNSAVLSCRIEAENIVRHYENICWNKALRLLLHANT